MWKRNCLVNYGPEEGIRLTPMFLRMSYILNFMAMFIIGLWYFFITLPRLHYCSLHFAGLKTGFNPR